MANDLVIASNMQLTAEDVRKNVNLVQQVMQSVMKEGTHYGTIPGTPKPSLWKPGAEVLAATFRISVTYHTDDLSSADEIRYRVTAFGTHQTTGIVMGTGMGECSSNEGKYKWRKAVSKKEFEATPDARRRIQYGRNDQETMQVRTDPADLANTVLKMACKRAQVAMTLNVTAASDIFTQDIEDLPEELRNEDRPPQREHTGPVKAAQNNVPEEYEKYEADVLPVLQEAATKGLDALSEAFAELNTSPLKSALWIRYGESLKQSAAIHGD